LKSAKVNFIVYWRKEGEEEEVKIILPELYFSSSNMKVNGF
jgi:ATP-dependent DNA helicase RecQ